MIHYRLKKYVGSIIVIMLILVYATPGAAHEVKHARKHYKPVVAAHPFYVPKSVHGERIFYDRGIFYRRAPSGYMAIRAPFGAIVVSLPVGFQTVFVGGAKYYAHGGVYYTNVPLGYMVVKPPKEDKVYDQSDNYFDVSEKVVVNAYILNVRSGPGMSHPVINELHKGNILLIKGYSSGWLYVELTYGKFGWVMSKYVSKNPLCPSG